MDNDIYWQAVKANDARYDGAFFLGVKTTGIYCRPSCRARLPKRENVEFFATAALAEQSGLRACLRCDPKATRGVIDAKVKMVIRSCELIESDVTLQLDDLARAEGLSPSHFQRVFKELVGVSPKKYAEIRRIEKFKRDVRGGSDLTAAMYDAGFGSSSRLYEKSSTSLGMTPAQYQRGGKGMKIEYASATCELGRIMIGRTAKGVCFAALGDDDSVLEQSLKAEFVNAEITEDSDRVREYLDVILDYLAGQKRSIDLPLDIRATAFQMQVWDLLRKIPFGQTVSYSQIAEMLGDKEKVRAVARACSTNRVALAIPCHRVVASDGKLSGYRWGIERKRALLKLETSA